MTSKLTRGPLFAEVHNVPDDYHFTAEELDRIIAGDMFTPRQGAIMARELQERRKAAMDGEQMAIENFRSAIEGIGHIRRTLEETFGGLHGTHVEPDVLAECKAICDTIYAAYRHAQQPVVPDEKPMPNPLSMYAIDAVAAIAEAKGWNAFRAAMLQGKAEPVSLHPELSVWYGSMPESNGKINWTAILHRKGECLSTGITIELSEYPERVRYEADRVRHIIGELKEEPDILAYDADEHSGYVKPGNSPVIPDGWIGNDKANAALMMLDRIETVDPVDDDRIDGIKHIIHELASAPQEVKGE